MAWCFLAPSSSGAPNRPLPPTPDEEESGERTLVMKRVSLSDIYLAAFSLYKTGTITAACGKAIDVVVGVLYLFLLGLMNLYIFNNNSNNNNETNNFCVFNVYLKRLKRTYLEEEIHFGKSYCCYEILYWQGSVMKPRSATEPHLSACEDNCVPEFLCFCKVLTL